VPPQGGSWVEPPDVPRPMCIPGIKPPPPEDPLRELFPEYVPDNEPQVPQVILRPAGITVVWPMGVASERLTTYNPALNPPVNRPVPRVTGADFEKLLKGIACLAAAAVLAALHKVLERVQDWARTRTRSQKRCDPAKCATWVATLLTRPVQQPNTPFGAYQLRQTGSIEYLAVGGGSEIWADGIRIQDCYFLEAKHVGNPTSSPFVPGSNFPAFLQPGVDADIIGEVTRYTAIINDPSTPMVGLEIITNDARAVPYFQGFLGALPNGRVVVRP